MTALFSFLLRLFTGAQTSGLFDKLERAYEAKLAAQDSIAAREAERDIVRLTNAIEIAKLANADRWSATSIGRYLIVIPFGVWYAAIILDSLFGFTWNVLALPDRIMSLSEWLFPVIVAGDIGGAYLRRR